MHSMSKMSEIDPRYPVGRVDRQSQLEPSRRAELIGEIEAFPESLKATLSEVRSDELELRYRDGGWTIRQVVHHLADSHINLHCRLRLSLTEETPTIRPYNEALWAELPDVSLIPPEVSVTLIEALHRRIVAVLRALPESAFRSEVVHPEHGRRQTLDELITIYSWHGRHHIAHIRQALDRGRAGGD